jgi:TetR/AcrR family transcriptional repressor of lmrAB and yxaGH operons
MDLNPAPESRGAVAMTTADPLRPEDRAGPLTREAIVVLLMELFRRDGFEGVSMADVARATGIGKSSLYHHFPGGKEEMAAAVMEAVDGWVDENLVAPLRRPGPRGARVEAMLDALAALYDGGAKPCLIASMLVGAEAGPALPAIRAAVAAWLDALQSALEETGARPEQARAAARDAVARIQGALVLCRALGEREPFAAAVAAVRRDLAAL